MLNVPDNTTCYDLTEVEDGISVVDCRAKDEKMDDVFFVVNVSNPTAPQPFAYFDKPMVNDITDRKGLAFRPTNP